MTDWATQAERRIGTLETRSAVEDVHRENVEKRLTEIEDTLKWLVRLVIGALLTAGVALIVGGPLAG
ncbi:hemolysin XhlA family protein [Pelagovum pacificum]|uniref:Pseudouridine synthase n=1 Tax=Pelagovum pacificum TaxID=2588711 RepID=A0A5C5GCS1_9RHOB|nr:hemolysin XhlA family protein [Pelagovum pacificum]QQA44598.1 hemolysin XhlA family protein [Pelagovum pacificum]TNY32290.1 pseudouridine synthase [Pelagovum pacificum]